MKMEWRENGMERKRDEREGERDREGWKEG